MGEAAPLIRTRRLDLEPLTVDHVDEMLPVLADAALYEVIGGGPPDRQRLTERYELLLDEAAPPAGEQWLNWVVRVRSSGAVVGTVQATVTTDAADLAWLTGVAHQGRGYASEAAAGMADWLLARGCVLRAHVAPGHVASERVAAAVGLVRSGLVDPGGEEIWTSG